MNYSQTFDVLGNVDIYVIDQILKNRYTTGDAILDAGCGSGRNLKWFYQDNYILSAIDANLERLALARENYPKFAANFIEGTIDALPYSDRQFDHILCCAVLHFAKSEAHLKNMFSELCRVLKPNGTLLIRAASNIGLDGKSPYVQDRLTQEIGAVYLTRKMISELIESHQLTLIEPIKTTNVQDIRAMTTLVFQKQ
ncbi:Methyltransferase type 11 [unidentified eubacterium SCB49]|nr:Methyltransferase type 11 [unidentified eubacterium SCB49]